MIFFSGGCEDRPILWAFFMNLSLETIYLSSELREKMALSLKLPINLFFNTAHNLITFSIVFTKKNLNFFLKFQNVYEFI